MNKEIKTILITGSSKGIGKYLAEYYSSKEYQVIGCSRGENVLSFDNYEHFCLDISEERDVRGMFSAIKKKYKQLDILINNAAVNPAIMPFLLAPLDMALNTMRINYLGTFLMSREAAKLMIKKKYGRIINFSSMAVKHEVKGEIMYTASKAAIISLTRIMAKELYGYGITCNVIAPSAIKTDMLDKINKVELNKVLALNAIDKLGTMNDVSNAINWLINSDSDAITGQVIYLGGV